MISATLSARSIAFAPTRMGICPHCGFACSEDACYVCRTPPTRATATSTYWRSERFRLLPKAQLRGRILIWRKRGIQTGPG